MTNKSAILPQETLKKCKRNTTERTNSYKQDKREHCAAVNDCFAHPMTNKSAILPQDSNVFFCISHLCQQLCEE